jgi:hypothetical protein
LDSNCFDFGEVANYEDIKVVFYAKNISNHPIPITNATTSCGCDVPEAPRKPILPGEVAKFSYTYDSHRIGVGIKTMTIFTEEKNYLLKFKFNVLNEFSHGDQCYNLLPQYVVEKPFDEAAFVKFRF